ncbi:hypothetical protein Tdes44962_MAKER02731 [Teratosphaeria destructans]|uniref:Uncharacterized protein n=1 Tax=Teratosphaeria destructans TaxID=418781 RepID=A0A9W7W2F1_9PEZI|nr:hypothetical protein Tdes44962_MAKER02731 [Teratosphaeria destructans]
MLVLTVSSQLPQNILYIKDRESVVIGTTEMAENGDKEQTDTAVSTPTSSHQDGRPDGGTKAPKDRSCPFCGQAFTSSSLGRHLDLYIKPKNPKPPDGVHDVEEIMKMRGGITRRQPKSGSKAAASSVGGSASAWHSTRSKDSTPQEKSGSRSAPRTTDSKPGEESTAESSPRTVRESMPNVMNSSHWMNTGIIPNLPPRAPSRDTTDSNATGQAQRMQEMRQDSAGQKTPRPEPDSAETAESMWKLHEDAEVGRAAELALREILSSIHAARQKAQPRHLFEDVDFFALSFPGLCLAILPAPSTLFSPTPFPSGESWTLTPPGQKQYETLNRLVHAKVKEVRNGDMSRFPDSLHFKHSLHLQGAFEHWQNMSEADQASAWTLETLRAFSKAQDARKQDRQELEVAKNRIRHLEQEFDRISRCQLPREYLLHPPHTMPAPAAIVQELSNAHLNSGAAEVDFDPDVLLDRWRTTVRATKPKRKPTVEPTRATDQSYHGTGQAPTQLASDMLMNGSVWGVQGPFPRPGYQGEPSHNHVAPNVNYTTPPNPGAVLGADDEDAEGEIDRSRQDESQSERDSALIRRSDYSVTNNNDDGFGGLNQNGKRPLQAASSNGRTGGTKLHRARVDGRDVRQGDG